MEMDFQERIARAKEAARLASIAAMARSAAPPAPAPAMQPSPSSSATRLHSRPPTPPADVQHRIDRLVEFIERNGAAFEALTIERERDNPTFAFLRAGEPYHDYFVWKKQASQSSSSTAGPSTGAAAQLELPANWNLGPSSESDPMLRLSVGAMANVCRLAKARGIPPYALISSELLAESPSAPGVEPGRLEIRLDEFYRGVK
ncbi:hypothetical protein P43SY_008204 [Pythium insidiosum]|uniref:SURP motif domain-containing protein n=1 Tax=Pythium insidiosum TaxID=114742 RepID=A0AAD5Q4P3_PYTIN|nr:hypothetical protein P43SY_008204 [Pythium insidiosum]KAJ0398543.1 hypothetical protein ATCC90586_010354 [Pythium insidiosum]